MICLLSVLKAVSQPRVGLSLFQLLFFSDCLLFVYFKYVNTV